MGNDKKHGYCYLCEYFNKDDVLYWLDPDMEEEIRFENIPIKYCPVCGRKLKKKEDEE